MSTVYDWLVHEGLWRDILSFAVGGVLLYVVGRIKLLPALRRHEDRQAHIEDLLNADTPGGLGAVVESNERIAEAYKQVKGASSHRS